MILEGITKKGKEKIKINGDEWKFIKEGFVQFAPDKHILLESIKNGSRRWIKQANDKDFKIRNL